MDRRPNGAAFQPGPAGAANPFLPHTVLAVRVALGASRWRTVRYLLAESALLAVAAALVGVVLTEVGIGLLRPFGGAYFPRMAEVAVDGSVLSLLAAVATRLMSSLLFRVGAADALTFLPETFTFDVRLRTCGFPVFDQRSALLTPEVCTGWIHDESDEHSGAADFR
jgi:hypothetical protein